MKFVVRDAVGEDAPSIVDFQIAMAWETEMLKLDRATVSKGVDAVFKDQTKGRYFVVEKVGAVVGSLLITYEWSDWRNNHIWWIQSVFVVDEMRGQGVFRLMYEHVKEYVEKDEGIAGLRLYVDLSNQRAQQVYRRMGMNGDHYAVYEWMKPD